MKHKGRNTFSAGFVMIFVLIVTFLVFLSLAVIYFTLTNRNNNLVKNKDQTVGSQITVKPTTSTDTVGGAINKTQLNNDIPELFRGVKWGDSEKIDSSSDYYFIYIDLNGFSVGGERWIAKLDNETYFKERDEFEKYYSDKLLEMGWINTSITAGGYKIEPEIADGPTGSTWAFLRSNHEYVRTVILSTFAIEDTNKYELEVFVSDPVKINELSNIVRE